MTLALYLNKSSGLLLIILGISARVRKAGVQGAGARDRRRTDRERRALVQLSSGPVGITEYSQCQQHVGPLQSAGGLVDINHPNYSLPPVISLNY